MSYDVMQIDRIPCACGAGGIERISEMSDWNQWRTTTLIHCPTCNEADEALHVKRRQQEADMRALLDVARNLAVARYLPQWLSLFEGRTKKAAWQIYRGERSYPALGTFYAHVKSDGSLEAYLRAAFDRDFAEILQRMVIQDDEIASQLAERQRIGSDLAKPISGRVQD